MNELTQVASGKGVGNRKLIILVVALLSERAMQLIERLFTT